MSEESMAGPTAPAGRGIPRDRHQSSRFVQGIFRPREEPRPAVDAPVARYEVEPAAPAPAEPMAGVQDLLKVYLRDVSRHNLLSREGEVAVAQRIEASKVTLLVGVLSCKVALPTVGRWVAALDDGTMTPSDFFAPDPPVAEGEEEADPADPALDDTPLGDLPIPDDIPEDEAADPDKVRSCLVALRDHLEGVAGGSKKGKRPSGASARELAVQLVGDGLEAARFEELGNAFEEMVKGVSARVRSCPWQGPVPPVAAGRREGPVGLIVRRLRARGEARPQPLVEAMRMLSDAGLEPERFGRLAADVARARRELAAAKEEMTSSNLRLVISIARRSKDKGLQFIDLVQEGNIGLMRAVDKFDYRRGYKFATYATWWIRQSVTRALADQGRVIRVPVHTYEKLGKIHKLVRAFNAEHGRDPKPAELSEASGLPVDQIRRLLQTVPDPVSLDTPMGDEGGASIADVVEDRMSKRPDDILHEGDIRRHILDAMADLTPREERVLRLRYGINIAEQHTLEQCGEIFGVTRERIRQIEAKALEKLKHPSRTKTLRTLL